LSCTDYPRFTSPLGTGQESNKWELNLSLLGGITESFFSGRDLDVRLSESIIVGGYRLGSLLKLVNKNLHFIFEVKHRW